MKENTTNTTLRMNYVYIVECSDNTLYTGWTTDVEQRIAKHNSGKGAKYTKVRLPVVLKYVEKFENKQDAQKREYEIKQLSRAEKLKLIGDTKADCHLED